jgi:hypothetical protein
MSAPPSLPPDLQFFPESLAATERQLAALLHGLPPEALHWQPEGGRAWSVAQIVDHLHVTNRVYLKRMERAADGATAESHPRRGPIAPGWFSRFFLRSLDPGSRRRIPAPRKIVPTSAGDLATIWPAYAQTHVRAVELAHRVAGLDLNDVRFPNPFIPIWKVSLGTGFTGLAVHERRHLGQAERVLKAPGFPG